MLLEKTQATSEMRMGLDCFTLFTQMLCSTGARPFSCMIENQSGGWESQLGRHVSIGEGGYVGTLDVFHTFCMEFLYVLTYLVKGIEDYVSFFLDRTINCDLLSLILYLLLDSWEEGGRSRYFDYSMSYQEGAAVL